MSELQWLQLPDGSHMARGHHRGREGTYFIRHDPTIEDGKPWGLTWESDSAAPREAI